MTEDKRLLFLYTETPLHVGADAGLGAIDLPIQRERITRYPMIQGSGIKGALREQVAGGAKRDSNDEILFGPAPPPPKKDQDGQQNPGNGQEKASKQELYMGAASFTDAQLLLFPVRAAVGGWVWVTCPLILARLVRHLAILGQEPPKWAKLQNLALASDRVLLDGQLILEDISYPGKVDPLVGQLGVWLGERLFGKQPELAFFQDRLKSHLVVMPDQEFSYLVEHCTEVQTRVRIDEDKGIVSDGALWTEESLPAETVLWSLAHIARRGYRPKGDPKDNEKKTPLDTFMGYFEKSRIIWVGGDRAVGRGLVRVTAAEG